MATLPSDLTPIIQSYNKSYRTRSLEVQFGGNYRQRAGDGINPINREIMVEFIGSKSDIATYVSFFEDKKGHTAFDWTPPDEATSRKWTCKEWSVTAMSDGYQRLMATLRKEFDLV